MSFKSFEAPPPLDNQNIRGREQENNLDPAEVVGDGINWMEKNIEKEKAIKQSIKILNKDAFDENFANGVVYQGFFSLFRSDAFLKINPETGTFDERFAEVVIIDTRTDNKLKGMCEWARELGENPDLSINEKTYKIALRVFRQMGEDNSIEINRNVRNMEKERKEIKLGDIRAGTCRHRALLFHKLAKEAGLNSVFRQGYMMTPKNIGNYAHAWNEVLDDDGNLRIVDIMCPPEGFGVEDYEQFEKDGGFPHPKSSRLASCVVEDIGIIRYCDFRGNKLYEGIRDEDEFLKRTIKEINISQAKEGGEMLSDDEIIEIKEEIEEYYPEIIANLTKIMDQCQEMLHDAQESLEI
ncbi:MAG: hypothetical protein HF967_04230 [Methanosarcinales archaeon]|nr:hypothetical protein [Methanosarcinales archaeon]